MVLTALLSLAAGGLTVLAPCVLPFLPVIVGGSLQGERRRPFIVAAALVVSLLAFTILLKATTVAIGVDPRVWSIVSGVLVVLLGIAMLFPGLWAGISQRSGLNQASHKLLDSAKEKRSGTWSAILTGIALGPVFSSCSPTYAWVIAAVLPANPATGMIYLALYCLGVASALLAISLLGRKLISKLGWAVNPTGWFQRTVAILFIIVGLFVATGFDKKIETKVTQWAPSLSRLEESFIPDTVDSEDTSAPGSQSDAADTADSATPAPDFSGISQWLNAEPQTLEQLRGKVVLVDFWTYSCINCIRTQPYLNAWYDAYHDQGLEIIGVHAPEFAFEKDPDNVQRAIQDANIKYPVALDNDFSTWNAYHNRYWPAKYLIDKEGNIRYFHAGEGNYDETEDKIRELLQSDGPKTQVTAVGNATHMQSPETYLGTKRAHGFVGKQQLANGEHTFHAATQVKVNEWTLGGTWEVDEESIQSSEDDATLTYHFRGRDMYLVLGGAPGSTVQVSVDGKVQSAGKDVSDGTVTIDANRLYHLVHLPTATEATVTLTFSEGVSANAFTFGG